MLKSARWGRVYILSLRNNVPTIKSASVELTVMGIFKGTLKTSVTEVVSLEKLVKEKEAINCQYSHSLQYLANLYTNS